MCKCEELRFSKKHLDLKMEAIPYVGVYRDKVTGETFILLHQNLSYNGLGAPDLRMSMNQFSGLMTVLKSLEWYLSNQNQPFTQFPYLSTNIGVGNIDTYNPFSSNGKAQVLDMCAQQSEIDYNPSPI